MIERSDARAGVITLAEAALTDNHKEVGYLLGLWPLATLRRQVKAACAKYIGQILRTSDQRGLYLSDDQKKRVEQVARPAVYSAIAAPPPADDSPVDSRPRQAHT